MEKVLVTGADGLLGSNLVRWLLERGVKVRVIVYPGSRSNTLDGLDIEVVSGDITDAGSVESAMAGCGGVYHCAASTAMWPPRDPKITAINVTGTRNVLDAAEKLGASRLVHVGSASSFGYGTKENPGTEETPYRYGNIRLAYFESKLQAQNIVLARAREGRVDAVVVNPTFMFGPYDSGPSSGEMIVGFVKLKPPFYPPGGRCFIHVRDAAAALISAMEKGKTGECYILGNRNMSMKELFEAIAEVTGGRAPKMEIPPAAIRVAGIAGSAIGNLTGKAPKLSAETARLACIGSYYSAAKAVRELGMPQTPVETALEDSYRWLKDNGHIN